MQLVLLACFISEHQMTSACCQDVTLLHQYPLKELAELGGEEKHGVARIHHNAISRLPHGETWDAPRHNGL
jgi:hypothetical protein